jgi:hypothetical protein
LDFLATHPLRMPAGPEQISGIGRGVLYGITETAVEIGAKALWGEATKASAPIYEHIFGIQNVKDQFYVPEAIIRNFHKATADKLRRSGLR